MGFYKQLTHKKRFIQKKKKEKKCLLKMGFTNKILPSCQGL